MSVTLSSTLPKGDVNGLDALTDALTDSPKGGHVVLMVVEGSRFSTNLDTGEIVRQVRATQIEAFAGGSADANLLINLLRAEYQARTGKNELPFEPRALEPVEDPVDVDPYAPEPEGLDADEVELLCRVAEQLIVSQHGSQAMVQRKLRIGWAKAARLLTILEAYGVVGEANGITPREVRCPPEDLDSVLTQIRATERQEGTSPDLGESGVLE
ncbi:DNA translocase FtsK [Amycolatopsis palatopharyngis]|uniref:DNA translocase FtsK n=1 Tax=Amycolatopsis palatopharyngis TaxID=187982 RepID=UPI000E245458|nr:DNA translocase FtsK [Amycolatopsis palatopharyngis]